jgi:hypothetical protein
MYREPHWRWVILTVVILTLVTFVGTLALRQGAGWNVLWLAVGIVTVTGTAIYVLWLVFDKYLWKVLPRYLSDSWPDLSGVWKGSGVITQLPPDSKECVPIELEVKLTIRQTYTAVWVAFESNDKGKSKKSSSHARGEIFQPDPGAQYQLHYHFVTETGSYDPDQHGLAVFRYRPGESGQPDELDGEWVSRFHTPITGTVNVSRAA